MRIIKLSFGCSRCKKKKGHKSHVGKMEGAYTVPGGSGKLDTRLTPVHRYTLETELPTIEEKRTEDVVPKNRERRKRAAYDTWLESGLTSGWLLEAAARTSLDFDALKSRLEDIGWREHSTKRNNTKDHTVMMAAPDGHSLVTIAVHNYDEHPDIRDKVAGDILRVSRYLEFLFHDPFVIPKGFNRQTMRIEEPQTQYKTWTIAHRSQLPSDLGKRHQMKLEGKWEDIEEVDWINNQILTPDGRIFDIPEKNIEIRQVV
jgi:hypothetical protein